MCCRDKKHTRLHAVGSVALINLLCGIKIQKAEVLAGHKAPRVPQMGACPCTSHTWTNQLATQLAADLTTKCGQVAACSLHDSGTVLPHLAIVAPAVGPKLHGVASEDVGNVLRQVWVEEEQHHHHGSDEAPPAVGPVRHDLQPNAGALSAPMVFKSLLLPAMEAVPEACSDAQAGAHFLACRAPRQGVQLTWCLPRVLDHFMVDEVARWRRLPRMLLAKKEPKRLDSGCCPCQPPAPGFKLSPSTWPCFRDFWEPSSVLCADCRDAWCRMAPAALMLDGSSTTNPAACACSLSAPGTVPPGPCAASKLGFACISSPES